MITCEVYYNLVEFITYIKYIQYKYTVLLVKLAHIVKLCVNDNDILIM